MVYVFYHPHETYFYPEGTVDTRVLPGRDFFTGEECHVTMLESDGTECGLKSVTPLPSDWVLNPLYKYPEANVGDDSVGRFLLSLLSWDKIPVSLSRRDLIQELQDAEFRAANVSNWLGVLKKRQEFDLTYMESSEGVETEYGVSYRHTFMSGNNVLIWWTAKVMRLTPGDTCRVKATVVGHDIFRGVRLTKINRLTELEGEPVIAENPNENHGDD